MLAYLLRPFYNKTEGRLRAFWRLLIQFGIERLIMGALIGFLPLFVIVFLLITLGRIPFSLLNDGPALSSALSNQADRFPLLYALPDLIAILVMVFAYYLLARALDRRSFKDYGFHLNTTWWADLGFGLLTGAGLIALVFAVEHILGWVTVTDTIVNSRPEIPFWMGILIALINFIVVGLSEELFARGYQTRNLAEGFNLPSIAPKAAILFAYLLTSLLFGLMHAGNPNATLFSTINLALLGLLLGLGFILTGELAIPIGLHIAWNFTQGHLFGFTVSGVDEWVSLIAIRQFGPAAWTGGAFGPEGGLLGIFAMLLGMLLVYGWVRRTRGRTALKTDLAEYSPVARQVKAAVSPVSPSQPTKRLA